MFALFNGPSAARPRAAWPKSKLVAALKRRYARVDDLGEESGFSLYGVTDGEILFAIAMTLVAGAPDKVSEIGFVARFTGFNLNKAELADLNRNLHLSVATYHTDGDLYLVGGVAAAGEFSENGFTLILEAWKRDLLVILHAMSRYDSLVDGVAAARLAAARRFAQNRAPEKPGGAADLFFAFAGGRSLSLCPTCDGRGKTGFIARSCGDCGGAGLVEGRRR